MVAVAAAVLLASSQGSAQAVGLESVDIGAALEAAKSQAPPGFRDTATRETAKLQAAEEGFQQSETLKRLLAKSEENRDKNREAIANKYCYRQAELGVGDCGGLRFIPGLTQSGKQRTPDWLSDLLGVERAPPEDEDALTLKKLFGGKLPE